MCPNKTYLNRADPLAGLENGNGRGRGVPTRTGNEQGVRSG